MIEIDPDNYNIYHHLGNMYRRINYIDMAILKYKKTLELAPDDDPNNIFILNNLGGLYFIANKIEEGIIHSKKTVDLDPEFALSYINLGGMYNKLNNTSEAIKNYCLLT